MYQDNVIFGGMPDLEKQDDLAAELIGTEFLVAYKDLKFGKKRFRTSGEAQNMSCLAVNQVNRWNYHFLASKLLRGGKVPKAGAFEAK